MSQQPCLPVGRAKQSVYAALTANGFDEVDIHSMDASEYLAMVVQESRRLPEVFLSKLDTGVRAERNLAPIHQHEAPIDGSAASLLYLVSDRTNVRAPPTSNHLPTNSEQWTHQTIHNFAHLRNHLDICHDQGIGGKDTLRRPVPSMNDRSGWHIFCVGMDDARGNDGAYFDDDDNDKDRSDVKDANDHTIPVKEPEMPAWQANLPTHGYSPATSLLLQMDQVLVRRVLSHLIHYIRDGWSPWNEQRASWIYALLARLERPIHREDAAVLFGLLKSLTQARSIMDAANEREKLAKVNVLIAIAGIYFEQGGGFAMLMKS